MDRQDGPGEEPAVSILSWLSKPVQFEALVKLCTFGATRDILKKSLLKKKIIINP